MNKGSKMSGKAIQRHEAARLTLSRDKLGHKQFSRRAYGALGRANRRGFIDGMQAKKSRRYY